MILITIFHSFVAPSKENRQSRSKVRHVYGQCVSGEEQCQCW